MEPYPIDTTLLRTSPTSATPPKSPSKASAPFRRLFPRASVILSQKDVAALRDPHGASTPNLPHPTNGGAHSPTNSPSSPHSHSPTTPPLSYPRPSSPMPSQSGQARLAKLAGWQLADLAIQVVREVDARGGEKAGVGKALRNGCARALVSAREAELDRIASGGSAGLFGSVEDRAEKEEVENVESDSPSGRHTSAHTSGSAPESVTSSDSAPPLPSPSQTIPLIAAAKMKSMALSALNQLAADVEREAERRYPDLGIVQSKKSRRSDENNEGEAGDGSLKLNDSTVHFDGHTHKEKDKHAKPSWRDSRFWFSSKEKEEVPHPPKKKPHGRHGSPLGPPYTRTSYHPNPPRPRSMSAPHLPGLEPGQPLPKSKPSKMGRKDNTDALPTPPRSPSPIYEDESIEYVVRVQDHDPDYRSKASHHKAWRQTLENTIDFDRASIIHNEDGEEGEEPNQQTKEMIHQLDDGQFWSLYADCVDEVARRKCWGGDMAGHGKEEGDDHPIEDTELEEDSPSHTRESNATSSASRPGSDHHSDRESNHVFAKLDYGELIGLHAIVEAEAARRRAKDKPKRSGGGVMWDKEESEEDGEGESGDGGKGNRKGKKKINGWSIQSKQTIDLLDTSGAGDGADTDAHILQKGLPLNAPPRTAIPLLRPASSSASSASTLSLRRFHKPAKSEDKTASTVAIWSSEVVREDAEVERILERFGTLEREGGKGEKSGGYGVGSDGGKSEGSFVGGEGDGDLGSMSQERVGSPNVSPAFSLEDVDVDEIVISPSAPYSPRHEPLQNPAVSNLLSDEIFSPSPASPQMSLSPLRLANVEETLFTPSPASPGSPSPLRLANASDEDKELDLGPNMSPVPPPRVSSRKESKKSTKSALSSSSSPSLVPPPHSIPPSSASTPHLPHHDHTSHQPARQHQTPATGPVCPSPTAHPHRTRVRTALHSLSNTQLSLAARQVADEVRRRQRMEWPDGVGPESGSSSSGGRRGKEKEKGAAGEMDLERLPMHRLELLARDIAEEAIRRGMAK
ncbi:hypothetical protein HDV00_007699 [Rhizophlyctis rosea]|nr:hypothetical protein HDV00_007699 [Rhizophlyctis rosea]